MEQCSWGFLAGVLLAFQRLLCTQAMHNVQHVAHGTACLGLKCWLKKLELSNKNPQLMLFALIPCSIRGCITCSKQVRKPLSPSHKKLMLCIERPTWKWSGEKGKREMQNQAEIMPQSITLGYLKAALVTWQPQESTSKRYYAVSKNYCNGMWTHSYAWCKWWEIFMRGHACFMWWQTIISINIWLEESPIEDMLNLKYYIIRLNE